MERQGNERKSKARKGQAMQRQMQLNENERTGKEQ